MNDVHNATEDTETRPEYHGRMSPGAKEELYRLYLSGMTIKDLSLKYGIMPQRVKAIVFLKFTYWNEIYPKMGETHLRMGLQREEEYAKDFPFVDYGIDLQRMSMEQHGYKAEKMRIKDPDISFVSREEEDIAKEKLSKQKSRRWDFVPFSFSGKGGRGYLLKEWVIHKGKGAPKVSRNFEKAVKLTGSDREYLLSKKVRDRMKQGGPRYAAMGRARYM